MKSLCLTLAGALAASSLFAQPVNSWTNAGSGLWDDPTSWSLGILPNSSQSAQISSSGAKTVTIDSVTAQNYPASMTLTNLSLSGPNTLLLTNVGTNVPLTVLNGPMMTGTLININSSVLIENSEWVLEGGAVCQDGGSVIAYGMFIWENGTYYLTNGLFESGWVFSPGSLQVFTQYGGTALMGSMELLGGGCSLYGGIMVSSPLEIGTYQEGGAGYFQAGGTNETSDLEMGPDGAYYTLTGGVLRAGGISLNADLHEETWFRQYGGTAYATNGIYISGGAGHDSASAYYVITNGTLFAQSLEIDDRGGYAYFSQSGGNTFISGPIQFFGPAAAPGSLALGGGIMTCANVFNSNGCVNIGQSGGTFIVTNLLQFGGYCAGGQGPDYVIPTGLAQYSFSAGTLFAGNIELDAIFSIGSSSEAGRITNPGYFQMAGTLISGNADEQLGTFILASNAVIQFAGNSISLAFEDSSSEIWSNTAMLIVTNWNGISSGGGNNQLFFGSDDTDLTSSQLSQIQFVNPVGLPAGTYPAQILETGEVVPYAPQWLAFNTQGNSIVWFFRKVGVWNKELIA